MQLCFRRYSSISSMKMVNSRGLRGSPCLTPFVVAFLMENEIDQQKTRKMRNEKNEKREKRENRATGIV